MVAYGALYVWCFGPYVRAIRYKQIGPSTRSGLCAPLAAPKGPTCGYPSRPLVPAPSSPLLVGSRGRFAVALFGPFRKPP